MFFSYKKYHSPKNGTIIVSRFFSETSSIFVNKCQQSGAYIINMWKNAFTFLPSGHVPKNILMLGLGGGNAVALLQEKYPNSIISVVEWDEVMIHIAEELRLYTSQGFVNIIHADAFTVLPTLKELFDLIIIDLFTGEVPPKELTKSETLLSCKRLLHTEGFLLVNFYRHEQYKSSFKDYFNEVTSWKFKANNLAFYQNK